MLDGLILSLRANAGMMKPVSILKRLRYCCVMAVLLSAVLQVGCRTPEEYHRDADKVAYGIIAEKQQAALDKTEPMNIDRPSDILRRRLIAEQGLPIAHPASLGTDKLKHIEYWPEADHSYAVSSQIIDGPIEPNEAVQISLLDALQIGARNSNDYQSRKEDVFRSALTLDLRRNDFRNIFSGGGDSTLTTNTKGDTTVSDVTNRADVGVSRKLKNGIDLSAALATDIFNLLTQGGASSLGLTSDASVTIPLLRGAGRHIVTEPLTQAERDVVYAIYEFERFKRTFAVSIARSYYGVLRQMDSVANARENYASAIRSHRWSRRRADAGRIAEIDVDQALQQRLSARNRWISTQEQYKSGLDAFKTSIGLPTDALVKLDPNDLTQLRSRATELVEEMRDASQVVASGEARSADAPVQLIPADYEDAGPYEIDDEVAMRLALENRLDLRTAVGRVFDAQRQVVVRADDFKPGLSIGGSLSREYDDSEAGFGYLGGIYRGLLSLDLPLERTQERNAYRNSLIDLERATRTVQALEDQIKLAVRNALRTLLESRISLNIQAEQVVVAERRLESTELFLEAGRTEIFFLLEAQNALLSARNDLTSAVVNYRTSELELQRDLGLLDVDEKGLWEEFVPKGVNHVRQ